MKFITEKDINDQKWKDLLKKSNFSSVFQTSDFLNLFKSSEGLSADVFAIEKDNDYLSLVVVTIQKESGVKGYFSKRGIIYGGPLVDPLEENAIGILLDNVKKFYSKDLIYIEVRNSFDFSNLIDKFENSGYAYDPHLNVQLNVEGSDLEGILSNMKYNRRREVKLSKKEGAVSRLAQNEQEVIELYEMLKKMYAERVKLPVGPLSYFMNLYHNDSGKVFIVLHEDKIIGGAFCVYDDNSIYTLYYTGLRFYNKKIFPTHLAVMRVIEFAIENGMKQVDFMGAGKPDQEYGVRDFKLQFGGDLVQHGRFKHICNPMLYNLGVFGVKILAKLK